MSKKLIYVAMWDKELEELISFLRNHNYSETEIAHMELVLQEALYDR